MGKDRPSSISLLAILGFAGAVIQFVFATAFFAVGNFLPTVFVNADIGSSGMLLIVFGMLNLIVAYFLWSGQATGWVLTLVLTVVNLVLRTTSLFLTNWSLMPIAVMIGLDAVVLYFLTRSDVAHFFGGENVRGIVQKFKVEFQPRVKEMNFTLKLVRKSPLSIVGGGIVLFYLLMGLFAPLLAPPGHISQGGDEYMMPKYGSSLIPSAPNAQSPFGRMQSQYDIYYGCIWGVRSALRIGIYVSGGSLLIGLLIGIVAAYYGGWLDEVLMRFTDVILAFPGLILCMALVVVLVPSGFTRLDSVMLALVIVGWPGYSRLIRGEILRVKNEDYIEAAKSVGCSDLRVIRKHLLPNSIFPVLIVFTLDLGTVVLGAAALSFLGLGAAIGYADWGQIIAQSQNWIFGPVTNPFEYWYTYLVPGLFISMFVLGWNLLGDALRDILDPTVRRK